MKTEYIKIKPLEVTSSTIETGRIFLLGCQELNIVFDNCVNVENITFNLEVQVPETLSEFRELNNLSKEELLEWLIENYK